MVTDRQNLNKDIQAWIRFIEPAVNDANDVIVLGFGTGEHICELIACYPHLAVTVIDPRIDAATELVSQNGESLRYVNSLQGVEVLQQTLRSAKKPIPVISFRPCWYPHKVFFEWAGDCLLEPQAPKQLGRTSSAFILESLFR